MHIGYHECPNCGAHYATTHFTGCRFTGLYPQDIVAPVAPVAPVASNPEAFAED